MKIRFKIFVFILLLASIKTVAQLDSINPSNCALGLSGVVYDGETKEPLYGASIVLSNLNKGTVTNLKGEYSLASICAGNIQVECRAMGYKTITVDLTLTASTTRQFILHSDTCLLESVVITSSRPIQLSTQQTVTLEGQALQRTRGLSLGEAIKDLPGVSSLQTGPSIFKPVVQGMYGNRVLILNNGIRQEGQQWGTEHAPEVDPFIASKISIIKGASSLRYGSDAVGGVVLVEPKELRTEPGINGDINLVGLSNSRQGVASGTIDYNIKKIEGLSFRVGGTIKQAGDFHAPNYYLNNTGFRERNFLWATGYNRSNIGIETYYSQFNTTLGILSAAHFGNRTDQQKAIDRSRPEDTSGFSYSINRPYQDVSHELAKLKAYYKFDNIGRLSLIFARQFNYRAEYDKHGPKGASLYRPAAFKITTYTSDLVFEHHPVNSKFSATAGVSLMSQGNTVSGDVLGIIPNYKSYTGGLFLIERVKLSRLMLEAGIRYDYKWLKSYRYDNNGIATKELKFSNISGALGGTYQISELFKLQSSITTSFRPPAPNELFSNGLHHGTAAFEYGSTDFRTEHATNFSVGLNYLIGKLYGEIHVYNNFINNYIYLVPRTELDFNKKVVPVYTITIRGAFPTFDYKQTNALFNGIDLTLNDSLATYLHLDSKLSLLRAYNTSADEYLILTPPSRLEYGLKFLIRDTRTFTNGYLRVSNTIVAKKSRVPIQQDIKSPPSGYTLLNVEIGSTFSIGGQPLNLTLSANNVLNNSYRDYLDRFRYYTEAVGRNIILRLNIPIK